MRVLFIGGTGYISTGCLPLTVERGVELTIFNRGERKAEVPPQVHTIRGDITNQADREALRDANYDVVVQWIGFEPAEVQRDFETFQGHTGQYIFISSASAYEKPPRSFVITEKTPLANPFWQYSRNKIACEELLMKAHRENGFPVTIVRPSLTYGDSLVPLAINSWQKPYTAVARMRAGKEVIVHGDGTSLWVCTHNTDFAKGLMGLFGHPKAIGEAFQITSSEVLPWNRFYELTAMAAGVEPKLVHIASDFLAACDPEMLGALIGDKAHSVIFDNSKIRSVVPDYKATTRFADGIRRTIAWFDANPARQLVDEAMDAQWDKIISAYRAGLEATKVKLQ